MSVTFWQAILLGALQGLTEFLPVSSSAHLMATGLDGWRRMVSWTQRWRKPRSVRARAESLPPAFKLRVLDEKHVLKRAATDLVPASICQRAKQPYRAPDAAAFLQGAPPDYVNQLLGRECLASYGYFDPDKVGRLVAKLQRARVHAARDNMAFVGVLSTQLWHRQFVEGQT